MTTFMPFILKDDGVLILMSIALLYLIFLKTGNEKKTAFMAIEFRERDEDKIITGVTIDIGISGTVISEKSRIPKRRPWVVVGPEHGEYSTYSTLDKAATAFFERLSLIASSLEDN